MMILDSRNAEADPPFGAPKWQSRRRMWLRILASAGLTTLSVFFVMVCPCDFPLQTPIAMILLALSLAACLAAALAIFRTQQFLRASTPILRGVAAVVIAITVRFVGLKLAIDCVAWLAARMK